MVLPPPLSFLYWLSACLLPPPPSPHLTPQPHPSSLLQVDQLQTTLSSVMENMYVFGETRQHFQKMGFIDPCTYVCMRLGTGFHVCECKPHSYTVVTCFLNWICCFLLSLGLNFRVRIRHEFVIPSWIGIPFMKPSNVLCPRKPMDQWLVAQGKA